MKYPNIQLPPKLSDLEAYEYVVNAFQAAGIYVQQAVFTDKESWQFAPFFRCPSENRIDTFYIHTGPWLPKHIELLRHSADSLLNAERVWFDNVGVFIIADQPLPPGLQLLSPSFT